MVFENSLNLLMKCKTISCSLGLMQYLYHLVDNIGIAIISMTSLLLYTLTNIAWVAFYLPRTSLLNPEHHIFITCLLLILGDELAMTMSYSV